MFVFILSIKSHGKSEMFSSFDLNVWDITAAHKQLQLIKTLNRIWAWFAKHCAVINTQLDLPASSAYFQVTHQPRIETDSQEPIPAGFALVTQTHTHSHPRIFFCFSVEWISFALQALQHYLPPKAFCVPIFKEAKGKTQAIHLAFVLTPSSFKSHSSSCHSERWLAESAFSIVCSVFDRVATSVLAPESFAKCCAAPSWGQKQGAHLHIPKVKGSRFCKFCAAVSYTDTNMLTEREVGVCSLAQVHTWLI